MIGERHAKALFLDGIRGKGYVDGMQGRDLWMAHTDKICEGDCKTRLVHRAFRQGLCRGFSDKI